MTKSTTTDKKSFILYTDIKPFIDNMTDEQAGKMIKSVYSFVCNDVEICEVNDPIVNSTLSFIKDKLVDADHKYKAKCLKNKENAKKRWDANAQDGIRSDANACEAMPNDNDNDNDNDNEITKVTKKDKEIAFDAFYSQYPLKKSKQAAAKAWVKLSPEQMQKCLDVVESDQFKTAMECQNTRRGDFRKHPSTWLNQGCWDDDLSDHQALFNNQTVGEPF